MTLQGLVAVWVLSASGAWSSYAPVRAPLGHVTDTWTPPPRGGTPGNEEVRTVRLVGCDGDRMIWVSRFVAGVSDAGEQIQAWLSRDGPDAPKGLERKLFGKKHRLAEAIRNARQGRLWGEDCPAATSPDWKLALLRAPARPCSDANQRPVWGKVFWFTKDRSTPREAATAALQLTAGPPTACAPRISAALFDDEGRARLRYHADFGGVLAVELLGDGCQVVDFTYDPASQSFRASPRQGGLDCPVH